jgi:hypothetical protein
MSYQVPCPSCGLVHTLQESDLGRKLACAECNTGFTFDEPLKKPKAEAKEKTKVWAWAKGKADAAARAAQREICRRAEQRRLKSEARAVSMRLEDEARSREALKPRPKTPPANYGVGDTLVLLIFVPFFLIGMGVCAAGTQSIRHDGLMMAGLLMMAAAVLIFILLELTTIRDLLRRSQDPDDEP